MKSTQSLDAVLQKRNMTRKQCAKKARICEPYLLQLWRKGHAPYTTAIELGHLLGVPPVVFLWGYSHYEQHLQRK
ncbi:hypothetical protein IAD21_00950 [Abditibacteriota bacterium]|nr:hypothetical protein IAD21_00950 [Abditibacteriota bacterium]